jgi:DNA polymerase-1
MNPKYADLLKQVELEHLENAAFTKNSKILIVDGTNTYFRTFSASPALNDNGEHVGGFYGFINVLKNTINSINPSRVIIVFDGKGGSQRRKKAYSNYKEGRAIKNRLNRVLDMDLDSEQQLLRYQFVKLLEYLSFLPVTVMSYDHVEADDVIAYITTNCAPEKVVIYSNDKDYFQLINDRVSVYFPAKHKMYTKEDIKSEYGILPENFIWFKAIMGDKSDNVKGVHGIGITKFNSNFKFLLEDIYNKEQFKEKLNEYESKTINKAKESLDIIDRNYYIMQLSDVDISGTTKLKIADLFNSEIPAFNRFKLKKMMSDDKLNTLIKNFELWASTHFDKLNNYRNK